MPTIAGSQIDPPKNWDEFEDICADLFMLEWGDRNTTRHGRQGQRQYGVDIYGRVRDGAYVGVQCKGKRRWPPSVLTVHEIDAEIAKALNFRPQLTEFIFATIGLDDVKLQSHARAITDRHRSRGLFSVHIFGWDELTRRLTRHDSLVEKYYGYVSRKSIRDEILATPERTLKLIADHFRSQYGPDFVPIAGIKVKHPFRHSEIYPTHGFVGREELFAILAAPGSSNASTSLDVTTVHALTGLAGIGKTTFAREFAWRNRDRFACVWWLKADTVEDIVLGLIDLGSHFIGVPSAPKDSSFEELTSTAKKVLTTISESGAGKPCLLIYDNAESPNAVRPWLPQSGAHVVITTRWSLDWHGVATAIEIGALSSHDAASFLQTRAARRDAEGAESLAKELGYLPLALNLAGAYCKETLISFEDYRKKMGPVVNWQAQGEAHESNASASINLCIGRAAEISPRAEMLLGVLSVMAPERIPIDILHDEFISLVERSDAIRALRGLSLINAETTEPGESYISLHRLIQQVMKNRLRHYNATEDAVAAATLLIARSFPIDDERNNWTKCAALLPHALTVLDNYSFAAEVNDDTGWLAHRKSQLAMRVGRYREHLADKELFDAIVTYEENPQSAKLLATRFSEFKPEYRLRIMRLALEQPDNENLEPIREILSSQSLEFQKDVKATVEAAQEMIERVCNLLIQGKEETIDELVASSLDKFPVNLQSKFEYAFGKSEKGALSAFRRRTAREELCRALGIDYRGARPSVSHSRWQWLAPWSR